MTIIKGTEADLAKTAKQLIKTIRSKTVCLRGNLGAGKTTLVKHMLKEIGANEVGSSPTFNLVNHHHDIKDNLIAYHLDCYRIKNVEEALDMGIEDILNSDCYVFIEWPEIIESILPEQRSEITIAEVDASTREIRLVNLP